MRGERGGVGGVGGGGGGVGGQGGVGGGRRLGVSRSEPNHVQRVRHAAVVLGYRRREDKASHVPVGRDPVPVTHEYGGHVRGDGDGEEWGGDRGQGSGQDGREGDGVPTILLLGFL